MMNNYDNYSIAELHDMYKVLVATLTQYLEAHSINALQNSLENGKVVISFDNPVLLEEMIEIAKRMVAIEKKLNLKVSYFDVKFTPEMFKKKDKNALDIVCKTYSAYANLFADTFKKGKN